MRQGSVCGTYRALYGEFIDAVATYAQANAAGLTEMDESEWNQAAIYVRAAFAPSGTMLIFRQGRRQRPETIKAGNGDYRPDFPFAK